MDITSSGSPVTVTVFWREVCPDVTSERNPVMSRNISASSLLARPSSGGALTRTTALRLHSSYPSGPERLDLGDTDTSTSTPPANVRQTSSHFIPRHAPAAIIRFIYTSRNGLPMSPALDPMTFDELSELYRVEMKSNAVTQTRKDLFRAMANLLTTLRQEYDRQMALDPESIMCEGAEQRRKSAERLVKDVMRLRTQKICGMALRGATGSKNTLDNLTEEEKEYYAQVLEVSKRHISEVDRLRGRTRTVDTRIDEIAEPRTKEPEAPVPAEPEPVPEPDVPEMFDDEPMPEGFDDIPDEPLDEPQIEATGIEPVEKAPAPVEATVPGGPAGESDDLEPILIRVKEDLPEFAGPRRDYKLFKEDVVTLPRVLAEVLINADKAYAVRPTP